MISFNSKAEIVDKKNLYGRDAVLRQLIALAKRNSCVQVIGNRRFGKTSLLKTLETTLISEVDGKIYPLFVDFKEVGSIVQGTHNAYRYLIALSVARLTQQRFFTSQVSFREVTIIPSQYWENIYESLGTVNPLKIPGLFEEIITFFSSLIERTFLFLIDEYEYLFRRTFDSPTGFMKLRALASKLDQRNMHPFSFFVSGCVSWEKLCSITGSGEMNCIDTTIRVTPIEKDDFVSMWMNECDSTLECPQEIVDGSLFAFDASGGVPFFGKAIGSNWITSGAKPISMNFKAHFQEIVNALEAEERDTLFSIANKRKVTASNALFELRDSGIIRGSESKFIVAGSFFNDFLLAISNTGNNGSMNALPQTFQLTDEIASLIQSINSTNKAKTGKYIFQPVNDDAALMKDLRSSCDTAKTFSDFANSLYKIVFEKTKVGNTVKAGLPQPFRNTQLIQIIDIMRHSLGGGHLMGRFVLRQGQMSKAQMLQILTGSRNEPTSPEEFLNIQLTTLRMFKSELERLNQAIRNAR